MIRGLAIIAALVAGAGQAAGDSRGIDHDAHAAAMKKADQPTACADCHAVDAGGRLRGSPDHQTCFARCHAPMPATRRAGRPYPIEPERRPLCLTCHVAARLDAAIAGGRDKLVAEPAATARRDHALTMSHQTHAAGTCASCHAFARRAPRPHERCRSCHAQAPVSAKAPMAACRGCHRTPGANSRSLGAPSSPYETAATFDHGRHAPRVKAGGDQACLSCHVGLDRLVGNKVPRPRKATCLGCHDGKAAFSTTEARCRACHKHPQIPTRQIQTRTNRFGHPVHSEVACETCHPKGGRFDATVGHTLCARSGCHADDYDDRGAELCGTCHLNNEPWLRQHVNPPARGLGDFGVRFDHRVHQEKSERACAGCHLGDPDGTDVGLSSGHTGCAGANCHDAVEPVMTKCAACHVLGARARRHREVGRQKWSVREAFKHQSHQSSRGKPVGCDRCHEPAARENARMPRPAKKTCLGCHDGKVAFKATGHGCLRCHKKR